MKDVNAAWKVLYPRFLFMLSKQSLERMHSSSMAESSLENNRILGMLSYFFYILIAFFSESRYDSSL